jgi:DNA-binding MarR family transcriptional regulator
LLPAAFLRSKRVYLQHGYSLVEIGREAGLHYATVSRIVKAIGEMS